MSLAISLSNKQMFNFNYSAFLYALFLHLVFFLLSFPVAFLVTYVLEGFDRHLAYNFGFYGRTKNVFTYLEWIFSFSFPVMFFMSLDLYNKGLI